MLKVLIAAITIVILFAGCLFNSSQNNLFLGRWKSIDTLIYLGKDSLRRDSLSKHFVGYVVPTDSFFVLSPHLTDTNNNEVIFSIFNHFDDCRTKICLDTLWLQNEKFEFDHDSISTETIRNGEVIGERVSGYEYSKDTLYVSSIIFDDTIVTSSHYLFSNKRDTLQITDQSTNFINTLIRIK